MNPPNTQSYPLLALGFRPFFGLAALSALILMYLWKSIYEGTGPVHANYFNPVYWHAHEMLLGYTPAVIAGFLLTAVGNWTGKVVLSGGKLAGLSLLWLYGRILPFYSGLLPDGLIAIVDTAFLPVLAIVITKPLIAAKQYRNLVFALLLLLLFVSNSLVHGEILGLTSNTAWVGLKLAVATVIILILVIAGRIFPFFTERGLPGTFAIRNPQLDVGAVASAALAFGLQLSGANGFMLASASVLAGLLNIARAAGWYTQKIWYVPLLWVLYTGYGWIIAGFLLTALSAYSLVLPSLALHAFTLGGIGVLTLGMMARVALGHTGRRLTASNTIAVGFAVLNIDAVVRIFLPIVIPAWYGSVINISILIWMTAFFLFIYEYAPILSSPRVDGKAG